ncbi:bifunctional hydroxymethylpyrimidine kinase/phosphomethylpyrimidine kinase [Levilactobacillus enshiensis]|uniref:bifunctional hydroxymethylpyrimidine kinase/phosphomethylpyrimidine kinase n=1 Tax=Levilactobacillus enshiensis TaxID=2590213 RepID=UPI00117BD194|nr:bifunctional hydroxymethylpyrimidine kinase/phosphomethylpyrimidine kinase [Levilactobacillus enshiensis]
MENVLTIAGADSLAGGGIQADLKTFEELDVFGVSALTSVASILPEQVVLTQLAPAVVDQQLTSILSQLPVHFAKTGLLGDVATLDRVVDHLRRQPVRLVVDPVLVFKEGATDLATDYIAALRQRLLPLAYVTTPNLDEAAQLSGLGPITTRAQMRTAAARIQALGCPNVVVKGGTRLAGTVAVDYLQFGDESYWFETPKIQKKTTDGAGCTFSAAITALLATGEALPQAVDQAKQFVRAGIDHGVAISEHLGSVWQGACRRQE